MRTLALCIAAAGLLWAGGAGATLVKNGNGKPVGAASGGVEVGVPQGRVRVQCWQDGRKIIDENELAVVSLGILSQMNALRLRRPGTSDATLSLVTQARTTCLLAPKESPAHE
jgi:hypothetical protein